MDSITKQKARVDSSRYLSQIVVSRICTHDGLTAVTFKRAKPETRRSKPRLCGDLNLFSDYVKSIIKTTNYASCEVWDMRTRYKCGICDKQLFVCWQEVECRLHYCISQWYFLVCQGVTLWCMENLSMSRPGAPQTKKVKLNTRLVESLKENIDKDD